MSTLNKIVLESVSEVVKKTIKICAEMYNFDANEAMSKIGLEDIMDEEVKVRKEEVNVRKEEVRKEKKTEKKEKTEIPLPYNGELNEECCKGVKHNLGLYTQCKVKSKNGEKYCKMCENQANKNSHGKPTYGTMEDRLSVGLMDYVDPSGKKPEMYMNVLKKLNIPVNEAVDEATKQNIQINEVHLEEEEEKSTEKVVEKTKGRPKKSKKVLEVANDDDDLITNLLAAAKEKQNTAEEEAEKKKSEEAEKKKIEEAEKKKIEEAKKVEKKKREQEREAKEAEKKKREQERETKEAEKKKQEEEEEEKKKQEEIAKEVEKKKQDEASKESLKVKKINYKDGKTYLKSKVGIVYNLEQKEVGKWNDLTGEIDFNKIKEECELSDDEYEEEEEEEEEELEDLNKDSEEEDDE
jgi:hypothetical protein